MLLAGLLPALTTVEVRAQGGTLTADKAMLMTCVEEAFPEGEVPGAGKERKYGGDCIGLIARSSAQFCAASRQCSARETHAWLAIARDLQRESLAERNKAAVKAAVTGIEKQAKALCTAAAAASAWGGDQVAKGTYKAMRDDDCVRDAVAGMVIPLMGYLRGN
ncbi:MAG: hypothetical protein CFE31_10995 [Rhizobiales bacterium PAR1]|nr:MAG: hypothetical protein CFE31_10995 [Rhizobiales bacterium PAR1]